MDLFGCLPDELLCHILSFLTTKEAALTSVLSKRWLKLWTFVPNLDIDDSAFLHPEEGKRESEGILQSFMDFVDRVLNLQGDYPIKKFSLKCKTGIDTDRVDRWITNVLQRGVSDIDLFMDIDDLDFDSDSDDENYRLPQKLFVSSTLVKMKLRSKFRVLQWPGGTFLPMLKTLIITAEWIGCGSLEMLLPRFPVLEELCIAITEWIDCDETVSSPSLRKLTIYSKSCAGLLNSKSISFDTPNLLYLEYSDFVAEDYPKVNLTNLVEAQFNLMVVEDQLMQIRAPNNENDEDDVFLLLGNVSKLFDGIRNVQKLYLSEDTLEVLSLCCESMPVFNNLKYLRITSDEDRGWQAMPVLLRNCPHLETLVLEGLLHYVTDKCGDACDCISREDIGSSLLSCPVKKVQIKGFKGTMRESRMIRHFMESFPCLKEMEVYADELDNTTIFETPGMMKIVAQMLFKEFASSDVKFSMYTPIDKKWIQHNDEPFKARSSSPVEDLGVAFSNIK